MNYLRVTGPVEDVARFQKEAAEVKPPRGAAPDATLEALSFERLLPLPPESRTSPTEGPMAEWGCRGNAFNSERVECWDGAVGFRFVTPWNPPLVFLQRVSECWPTLVFVLITRSHGLVFVDSRGPPKGVCSAFTSTLERHEDRLGRKAFLFPAPFAASRTALSSPKGRRVEQMVSR